ncbi:MAG TPA: zf-HC2 domain-containing protein [Acidimicrobiales bacterium]|nr:zf-HC2 domain-containing protein [Acidimicrobiales bacterium]
MGEPATCREVREHAAELALGVLVGAERAAVLDHLETCAACREEVHRYSAAADAVLQFAPASDPPPGFEMRLLARRDAAERARGRQQRLARQARHRHGSARRPPRVVAAAAAAGLVLAAGIGVGATLASQGTTGPAGVRTAALSYDGVDRGSVVLTEGRPAVLVMTVDLPGWSGWVSCVVGESGGKEVTVGRFWLRNGHGSWSHRLDLPGAAVREAAVEAPGGAVVASATLP